MSILSAACRDQRRARERWGDEAQAFMVCEEGGELVTAMAHFRRGRIDGDQLLDEAADAVVVACCAAVLSGHDAGDLADAIMRKLVRLRQRLDGAEGHFGGAKHD